MTVAETSLDPIDRRLVVATQGGLPLVSRPFAAIGAALGLAEEEVLARFSRLKAAGIVRRIAAVPNHYAVGYSANAMAVWDIADHLVDAVGDRLAALACVSHCYRRARRLPDWPYNLYAMVHGRDHDEAERYLAALRSAVGSSARAHAVLWSRRILKKTGLRLRAAPVGTAP